MITIVYSTHKDLEYNSNFQKHLLQSVGLRNVQILEYENHNQYSLSEIYNRGISESKYDIVVCCHNDIKLEKNWGVKLTEDFIKNPEFGIIGKAGTCHFPSSGIYWERMQQTMVGQVYHHPKGGKKFLSKYSAKLPFLIPVISVDGLFIAFDKTKIKHKFDESYGKFHFYDHGFCLPNFMEDVSIGVTTSFEITHESVGQPNQEFFESKEKFLEKWGKNLPIDLKPKNVYVPTITEKPFKKIGKIAIIILTKGKTNLLYNCVESFYKNCNSELFDIFIGDTGSTRIEKEWIKDNILPMGNIKLIEYDYYNFAQINNDVVKNHITNQYEFLLFSNNDIKLLNNVVYGMLKIFNDNKKVGTVGARLHYEDNTIQHDGIVTFIDKKRAFQVTHSNLRSYYNFTTNLKKVVGSTGALLMIRKNVFERCGYFNENYISCFEDVELNLKCVMMGLDNFYDGSLVSYHLESQTRNEDSETRLKVQSDYFESLQPFVIKNLAKIKNHILIL
jgi:GT2 family glycosyltransferase